MVSTLTKETPTLNDEDLAKRLLIKLVKSICYHYSPNKPVAVTAQIIRKVITETTRFAERSAPHIVFAEIKRKEEKDWAPTSIFDSFLEKLSKGKRYVPVKDPTQVDNPDQMFKIFEGGAFDEKIHTLADTSDILGSLLGRGSLELERVSQVAKDYNLWSRFKSPVVTWTPVLKVWKRKIPQLPLLSPSTLSLPLPPVVPIVLMNWPLTPDGDECQTVINTLA